MKSVFFFFVVGLCGRSQEVASVHQSTSPLCFLLSRRRHAASQALVDRKTCALGMIKVVTDTPEVISNHQNVWIPTLVTLVRHFEVCRDARCRFFVYTR